MPAGKEIHVKTVKVDRFEVSLDGEIVILIVKDRIGQEGAIGLNWHDVPAALATLQRGTEKAKSVREFHGKQDTIAEDDTRTFFLVTGYEIANGGEDLKIMSLHIANGLRFDFAIPRHAPDPRGTPSGLLGAISKLLIDQDPGPPPQLQ